MRELDFNLLRTRLLKSGITPRHVQRTVSELRDHYDDLVIAAIDSGEIEERARCQAADVLDRRGTRLFTGCYGAAPQRQA